MHWRGCLLITKNPPPVSFFLPDRCQRPADLPMSPAEIKGRLGDLLGRV